MKARELALLLLRTPNAEVILSSDEEGNSFGGMGNVGVSFGYFPGNIMQYEKVKGVVLSPIGREGSVESALRESIAWTKHQEEMKSLALTGARVP